MSKPSTPFRWQHDGADGGPGTATYYFMHGSVTLHIDTFKKAFELNQAIKQEREDVASQARRELLREIVRIKP